MVRKMGRFRTRCDSPVGDITMVADDGALLELRFDGHTKDTDDDDAVWMDDLPVFRLAFRWLDEYFAGRKPEVHVPIRLEGTPFREEIWALLREVPYGETVSYGELAHRLEVKRADGRKVSARAVGGAVHHNPIGIMVPCHRVIGADGSLTGYAGGLDVKARLLRLEGVPKKPGR